MVQPPSNSERRHLRGWRSGVRCDGPPDFPLIRARSARSRAQICRGSIPQGYQILKTEERIHRDIRLASQQTNFNNTVGIEPDGYVMSTHLPLRKPTYAKRLTALGLAVTLGFTAIFGIILRDMGRRDRQKALDGETNLVATIASDISRNIELYDLSLQAVVDGLKLREINDIGPAVCTENLNPDVSDDEVRQGWGTV
jgi:hypothetical protein